VQLSSLAATVPVVSSTHCTARVCDPLAPHDGPQPLQPPVCQLKQWGTAHERVVSGLAPALAQLASSTTVLLVVSRHWTVCVCEPLAPQEGPHAPKPSASHE